MLKMDLWNQVNGTQYFTKINSNFWRIVEDQSRSTTRKFVSTSKEHDILENLIDEVKPRIKYYDDEKYFNDLHYLHTV